MNWCKFASLPALPTSNTILHQTSAISVQLAKQLIQLQKYLEILPGRSRWISIFELSDGTALLSVTGQNTLNFFRKVTSWPYVFLATPCHRLCRRWKSISGDLAKPRDTTVFTEIKEINMEPAKVRDGRST